MARREFADLPAAPRETGTVVVKTTGGALADVSLTEGGSAIAGSTLTVAADAVIPSFWGPADGTSTLVVTMHSHGLDWHATVLASDAAPSPASLPTPTTGDAGKVLTVTEAEDGFELAAPSGGSVAPGVPVVTACEFAFDTPDLLTGAALYTPTVGDVLIDLWIGLDTSWDGTTPRGDVIMGSGVGQFKNWVNDTIRMANHDSGSGNVLVGGQLTSLREAVTIGQPTTWDNSLYAVNGASIDLVNNAVSQFGSRVFPVTFRNTDPIKFVVSQDGTATGADPGSTVGAATLYVVTATPKSSAP